MADAKKLANEEITDKQANEASGGAGHGRSYTCDGCGETYPGSPIGV